MVAGPVGHVQPEPVEDTKHVEARCEGERSVVKADRDIAVLLLKRPDQHVPVQQQNLVLVHGEVCPR